MKILSPVHPLVSGSLNSQRLLVLSALEEQGFYGFSAILNCVQNLQGSLFDLCIYVFVKTLCHDFVIEHN